MPIHMTVVLVENGTERVLLEQYTPFVPFAGELIRIEPESGQFVVTRVQWQFDRSSPKDHPRGVKLMVVREVG